MRILLIVCMLALLPGLALAGADGAKSGCDPCVTAAAYACNKLFTIACIRVKYTPRCDWPEHQCAVPLNPCRGRICIDAPCHMPLAPYEPCGSWCFPAACHQPVVGAEPCDPCPVKIELTGDRELVTAPCEVCCAGEAECSCSPD